MLLVVHKAVVLSKEPWLAALQLLLAHRVTSAPVQGTGLSQPCQLQGHLPALAQPFQSFLSWEALSLFQCLRLSCPEEHNCFRSGRCSWGFCKAKTTFKVLRKKTTTTIKKTPNIYKHFMVQKDFFDSAPLKQFAVALQDLLLGPAIKTYRFLNL